MRVAFPNKLTESSHRDQREARGGESEDVTDFNARFQIESSSPSFLLKKIE